MTDADDRHKELDAGHAPARKGISRRSFLTGVAAAGAVAGLGTCEKSPDATTSRAITQEEVNQLYAKLYTQIKIEKETAEREGKKLVILIGEDHCYSLSLLHNVIISDIACRLNVREFIPENTRRTVLLREESHKDITYSATKKIETYPLFTHDIHEEKARNHDYVKAKRSEFGRFLMPFIETFQIKCYNAFLTGGHATTEHFAYNYGYNHLSETTKVRGLSHSFILERMFLAHGAMVTPGDPIQDNFSGIEGNASAALVQKIGSHFNPDFALRNPTFPRHQGRYDPTLEAAMAHAIQRPEGHRLALFGAAHLPFLYDALTKDHSLRVLAFDTKNREPDLTKQPPKDPDAFHTDPAECLNRYKQLAEMSAGTHPKIHTLMQEGEAPTLMDAYHMAMHASITHRGKTPEAPDALTPQNADLYCELLNRAHADYKERAAENNQTRGR